MHLNKKNYQPAYSFQEQSRVRHNFYHVHFDSRSHGYETHQMQRLSRIICSKYEGIIDFQTLTLLKHILAEVCQQTSSIQVKHDKSIFKIDGIPLSKSESSVLYYLIRGKTAKGIAEEVHLSNRTVEIHLTNLKDKLNCKNKSELIEKALDSGFYERFEC